MLWPISLLIAFLLHAGVYFMAIHSFEISVIQPIKNTAPIAITIAPASFNNSIANDISEKSRLSNKKQEKPDKTHDIHVSQSDNGQLKKYIVKKKDAVIDKKEINELELNDQPDVKEEFSAVEIKEEKNEKENSQEVQGDSALANTKIVADWQAKVLAHLMQYKRYPIAARKKYQQGSVLVSFDVDVSGFATNIKILDESKFPLLNREAKAVINRALPLPSPPHVFIASNKNVVVPINFFLL
jgi:protein TonB